MLGYEDESGRGRAIVGWSRGRPVDGAEAIDEKGICRGFDLFGRCGIVRSSWSQMDLHDQSAATAAIASISTSWWS